MSTTSTCSRPGCCCGIKDSFRNGKRSSCTVITARTGCEKTVAEALKAVDGVVDAAASFNDGVAKVRYNKKKVELAALAKAIEDKGYQVTGTKE